MILPFFSLLIIIALLIVIYFLLNKQKDQKEDSGHVQLLNQLRQEINSANTKSREELQQNLRFMTEQMNHFQQNTNQQVFQHFQQNSDIIKDITTKLSGIEKTNTQILSFTDRMRSLEQILKNPKQRGVLGEYFLETLLANVLSPNQFKMQFPFSNGEMVDAVIFFRDQLIPIDAKFSLENYNKMSSAATSEKREKYNKAFRVDVKKRIEETSKYIRPQDETTDFAFMFIPAEGVYYHLLNYQVGDKGVIEYAFRKRVIIVSPTSFYAYLETVLQGLKALQIEQSVKEVMHKINLLAKHLKVYEAQVDKMGKQLGTVVNTYNQSTKEFKKIDKDLFQLTKGEHGGEFDTISLDKPLLGEKE